MNLSISLLTLEKLPLTSFLNPTLQIALLEALPRGGVSEGSGAPMPHDSTFSPLPGWKYVETPICHSPRFLPPPRKRSDFLWLLRLGKGLLIALPQSSLVSEAGLLSFPVKAHLWVRVPACLLWDGLSQDLSQGKMFRSPTIS